MMKYLIGMTIIAFCLGIAVTCLAQELSALEFNSEAPGSLSSLTNTHEVASPYARVTKDQIHLFQNQVVIDLENPQWATFTDTNSMDPVFDAGHYALQVVPTSNADVHVGDIITYTHPDVKQGNLIHRVVQVGTDSQGWYAVTKGDNNANNDPGKVRFEQVKKVVAAIIY